MPVGNKFDNKKIAEIVSSYALTNSYSATAKECSVAVNSVKNVIQKQKKENPEEFAKICNDKKESFYEAADRVINKALILLDRRFDLALERQDEIDNVIDEIYDIDEEELSAKEKLAIAKKLSRLELNNLSEITTAIGTLYDKKRLEVGESTSNDTITVKMSDEIKELSK